MKFKFTIMRKYILLLFFACGIMQAQDLTGVVRFTQIPTLATAVDTLATKPIGRRTSDGRLVRYNWGQLKAYFSAGGSGAVPSLQQVLNVSGDATITTQMNVTAGGGTDYSQINVNPNGFYLGHDNKYISFTDEYHGTNSTFEVEDPIGDKDAVNKQSLESTLSSLYVPYIGATSDINLGIRGIQSTSVVGLRDYVDYSSQININYDGTGDTTGSTVFFPPVSDTNQTVAYQSYVDANSGIPLTGTVSGSPVTGNIVMTDVGLYTENTAESKTSYMGFIDGNAYMQTTDDISGYTSVINTQGSAIEIFSSNPGSVGIIANQDFSANNDGTNRNIYVQEGRMQDYVAAHSGGGGTVTSVTGTNGVTVATGTTTPVIGLGNITPISIGSATTATTQSANDNSAKIATTAYADAGDNLRLLKTNNLSDLQSVSTARTNLGLTSLSTTTPGTGVTAFITTPTSANLAAALTDETGTGSVVFSASPTFTGTPLVPTAASGTSTGQAASTQFVTTAINALNLNIKYVKSDSTPSAAVTGTTSNTIVKTYLIPANTIESGNIVLKGLFERNAGFTADAVERVYINTASTFNGSQQLISTTTLSGSNITASYDRFLNINGTQIRVFPNSSPTAIPTSSSQPSTTFTINPAVDQYIIVALQNGSSSAADSQVVQSFDITIKKSN